MDIQKQEGPVALEVVTNNGVVALKASMSASLGGGSAAGVVSVKNTFEADVGASQALGLAGDLLDAHFPSLKGEIDALVALGQAQLAKV